MPIPTRCAELLPRLDILSMWVCVIGLTVLPSHVKTGDCNITNPSLLKFLHNYPAPP